MPLFLFDALDIQGSRITGQIEARDEFSAVQQLQEKHYSVLKVTLKPPPAYRRLWAHLRQTFSGRRVGARDLAIFTRQLSMLMSAGIHIIKSLDGLSEQTWDSRLMAPMAKDLSTQVREGKSLSTAMACHPKVFNAMQISLILSGERSGSLNRILHNLSNFLERDYRFQGRLMSALAYPATILVTSVSLLAFLLIYVFPKFMGFFDGLSIEMPWMTRALLSVTNFLIQPSTLVLAFIVGMAGFYSLARVWRTPGSQLLRERLLLSIPILSDIHKHTVAARFCHCGGLLLESGLGQMQTMELLAGVLGSRQAQLEMQGMMVRVRDYGSSFGSEVADMKWMPKFCGPLILVAEEAGRLPEMLNRLAGQLEEEIDLLVMRALSFLEPIMLAVMGVAVGFVLWSVFVPIYKLVEQL